MQQVPLLLRLREASTPAHVRNMEDVNKTELSEMHDYPNWREEQQKQNPQDYYTFSLTL